MYVNLQPIGNTTGWLLFNGTFNGERLHLAYKVEIMTRVTNYVITSKYPCYRHMKPITT